MALGWISFPRSVSVALRPGISVSANAWSVPSVRVGAAVAGAAAERMRSATGSDESTRPPTPSADARPRTSRRVSASMRSVQGRLAVDPARLGGCVDLRRAGGLGGAQVHEPGAAAAWTEVGPELHREAREEARVHRQTAEPEVLERDPAHGLRLVEEVAAVPVPQLRRLALLDGAGPVVGLVVEALRAR